MEKAEIWPVIHAERKALATDLGALDEAQWATTSLCSKWTVRDVLAHMTATATMTPPAFFAKLAGSGFSFEGLQAKNIAAGKGGDPVETLTRFEAVMASVKHPPGPGDTWLGETIIHSEDIRRPLGIRHDYPAGAVVRVADFFKGSNLLIGAKKRVDGVALRATDADWSHGAGPEVSGPLLSLVLAMTGRKAALDDLSGEGVAALRARPQMKIPKPSDDDRARFRSLVPEDPRVEVKPMFGNLGAFVNGNMFMGLFGPDVGLKLPEAEARQVVASGGAPFGPAERPMAGYVSLPAGIKAGQARRLAARSLSYVGAFPAKKPKKAPPGS